MNTRFYLLMERLQTLDSRLRMARSPWEAALLRARKQALQLRATRLILRSAATA